MDKETDKRAIIIINLFILIYMLKTYLLYNQKFLHYYITLQNQKK